MPNYKTLTQTLLAAFSAILACATLEGGGVMRLAMRNIFSDGGGGGGNIPYVTDGLIAWYDGIYNAGIRSHASALSQLQNLAGTDVVGHMSLSGDYSVLKRKDTMPSLCLNVMKKISYTIQML